MPEREYASRTRMARAGRTGRLRLGHGGRAKDPALSCAPARRHDPAHRADGAGERLRRVARAAGPPRRPAVPHLPAIHARRHHRGRRTHDRLHHAAVAHLDPSPGRRPRGELRAVRAAGRRRRGAALLWASRSAPPGLRLVVRPFLSGRDAHALHHENPSCRADATAFPERVRWQPYPSVPAVLSLFNGSYVHAPVWYRGFQLDEERARGLEYLEDCLSPGLLSWDLAGREAVWILDRKSTRL